MVVDQTDDFALLGGERFDGVVELLPEVQIAVVLRGCREVNEGFIRIGHRGGGCHAQPAATACLPRQVEQLAAHLLGRQAEEIAHRRRPRLLQRPQEPQRRVLHHVAAVGPAAHGRKAIEHLAGETFESVTDAAQQLFARLQIARVQPVEPAVQLRGVQR